LTHISLEASLRNWKDSFRQQLEFTFL